MIDRRYSTALKPGLGIGLFFSIFVFMLIAVSLISVLIIQHWGMTTPTLRIQAVIQDVLMFILPAVVTALLMTRLPAEFLEIMHGPRPAVALYMVAAMILAIPAMNVVIQWNAAWPLPDSLGWLRDTEESAAATVKLMMGQPTPGNLVMSLLIIGVLTGVAEEMFFRGGLQKLLLCTRLNRHAAIWITATIFSIFHFQILGLVPRILLGALFGYAMYWSGSLWLPILLHAINNSLVVINQWLLSRGVISTDLDKIGTGSESWIYAALSLILTVIALRLAWKSATGKSVEVKNS